MATKAKAKAKASPKVATNGHTITLTAKGQVFVPRANAPHNIAKWALVCAAAASGQTTTQLMAAVKAEPASCQAEGQTYPFDFAFFGYMAKNGKITLAAA